jgi:hypothetical protein
MERAWISLRDFSNTPDPAGLIAQGRDLRAAGCDDPAHQVLLGLLHPEYPVRLRLLNEGVPELVGGGWSPLLAARGRVALYENGTGKSQVGQVRAVIADILAALDHDECAGDAGAAQLCRLWEDSEAVLRPYACRAAEIIAGHVRCPSWAQAQIIGQANVLVAWRYRGSGWSSSVTAEGWAGFERHLDLARDAFERAQALAPQRPEPSAWLITVAMGEGGDGALAAVRRRAQDMARSCPDYLPGLRRQLRALLPRWHGSIPILVATGLGWSASTAYDTHLPYAALEAFAMAESDLDECGAIYAQPRIGAAVERIAAGYASVSGAAGRSPIPAEQMASEAFRAAFLGGRWTDALRHWRSIDGRLVAGVADSHALLSSHLEGICAAGAALGSDLEGRSDLAGWEQLRGRWHVADGGCVVESDYRGHLAVWQVPVGGAFTCTGRLRYLGANGPWQAGIVFGPRPHDGCTSTWASVRFRPAADGVTAELAPGFCAPVARAAVRTRQSDTVAFRIRVAAGACTVEVDGMEVLDHVPLPSGVELDEQAQLGIGGYQDDHLVRIRYEGLSVERAKTDAELPVLIP